MLASTRTRSGGFATFRGLRRHPKLTVSALLLAVIVLVALFAPLIAPYDPTVQDLAHRLSPPFWMDGSDPAHLLGTDGYGRDYLSRLIYGTRVSLLVGACVTLIAGVIGTVIGITAGYFGGKVDQALMYVINARLAIPMFLAVMAVVVVFGASLLGTVLTLGFFMWDRFVVTVRSRTQQIRSQEFVSAARSVGASHLHILRKDILPNVIGVIMVIATIEAGAAILLEAALSFLGFGVQDPLASWGLMLSEARDQIFFSPWLIFLPGGAIFALVLLINLFSDGLRKALDEDSP